MLLLAGCGENSRGRAGRLSGAVRYDAQGAPYEIVVVADHDVWDGPAGDTLRAMFYKQYPMVNRQETTFDVLRVLPAGFKTLTTRHRNIMITDINPASYAEASLSLSRDTYARPQIVLTATAPDVESLTRLIDDNRDDIMLVLETTEKDRDVASATTHTPSQIAGLIEQKFGFEMATGPGYEVRSESDNFLWLSYEMPTSSQGIIIYSYPLAGEEDFDRDNLLLRRSEFVSRIPGENPGSYMTSVPEYVDLIYKRIDGRQWSEMHGFWDVEGDYMGGPYTNYSTLDAARGRIIAIDFYVYSPDPRLSQRSYIKQLEHLVYTVKIPDAAPSGE
jgi:hypothetical protein